MVKFKIKYIGWFFSFVWNCLSDLKYTVNCFNEIGLWKENWADFKTRICFDSDPETLVWIDEINEIINKKVNNDNEDN